MCCRAQAVTGMIDAAVLRFGTRQRLYLGHFETCSEVKHNPHPSQGCTRGRIEL